MPSFKYPSTKKHVNPQPNAGVHQRKRYWAVAPEKEKQLDSDDENMAADEATKAPPAPVRKAYSTIDTGSRAFARNIVLEEAPEKEEEDEYTERIRRRQAVLERRKANAMQEDEVWARAPTEDGQIVNLDESNAHLAEAFAKEGSGSEEEGSSSSSEEEGGMHDPTMAKPVFVKSSQRATMKERDRWRKQEEEAQERIQGRKRQREEDTKLLVEETVKREIEAAKRSADDSDPEMPSDDDDVNEAYEYQKWKTREMERVRQYKEERDKWDREKADIERRRGMTDNERRREDQKDALAAAKLNPDGDPVKWKFLQRYYHQGAHFQDEAVKGVKANALYRRDYGEATGEDLVDKAILPQVMQRKKFGLQGQVKWTHLVNEDTTQKAAESIFTSNTAMNSVSGSAHMQHNTTYDNQHFTNAFTRADTGPIGSSRYGASTIGKDNLLERPAARRRLQR